MMRKAGDNDVSTHNIQTRAKNVKDHSICSKASRFDKRCNQLVRFKEEFGHCNVPTSNAAGYGADPSLVKWCSDKRKVNNKLEMRNILQSLTR